MAQKDLHILLVESDPDHAEKIRSLLEAYPEATFQVEWKQSVGDALEKLEQQTAYDLIVTDSRFPVSSGLEFSLELNIRDITIPIIFLTADKDFNLAVEAMKIGVEDFLMKDDLSTENLGRALENVYSKVQTRRGLQSVAKRLKMAESRSTAVKELVVTVCHEFNNPLASVKISIDLLKRMMASDLDQKVLDEFEESFSIVEKEIIRLRDTNFERIDPHIASQGDLET